MAPRQRPRPALAWLRLRGYGRRPPAQPRRRPRVPDGRRHGGAGRVPRRGNHHRPADQLDHAARRRRAHPDRSGGAVHGVDRGADGPARQLVAGPHLRVAPGRGVHRRRQRRAADRGGRHHPRRGDPTPRRRPADPRAADDRGGLRRAGRQRDRDAAAALARRAQPGRQGRLHGGGRRHRRQHRRADRRGGHRDHPLALRRRGGGGAGRAVGAAAGPRAGRVGAADPVRILTRPHRRRPAAVGAARRRRRHRRARPPRLDAGPG
ncbi:hypothetical protein C1Y40_05683 [Mycobacterium talmoniae]|uniref:Uncharacterized protein n=1 Tax=Mycobacterium talmoniae TaxID=1858794 RepID=A0A2S8BBX6_9MYCO|nr:hypothetical protein C1Y40_05683 [Mycobacterium talmoniae]